MRVYLGINNSDNAENKYKSVRMVQAMLSIGAKDDLKWKIDTCLELGEKYKSTSNGDTLINKSLKKDYDMTIIINKTFAELTESI